LQTPSIKREWHEQLSPAAFADFCKRSLDAQLGYVKSNPLRFGEFFFFLPIRETSPATDLAFPGCFAILPLPHVQECIDFIRYAQSLDIRPDGFAAATAMGKMNSSNQKAMIKQNLTTSTGKLYLGDARLEPVWEELDKSGSMVFIHPSDTAMPPNLNFGPCEYLHLGPAGG
jgi:6-methylsalicylate decarboxylase